MSSQGFNSSQASSTPPPKFKNKQHFSRTNGQGGWYCNICTHPVRAHLESMNGAAAMRHERSHAHVRNVAHYSPFTSSWQPDLSGWELESTPYADLKQSEKQGRVDMPRDFVPFWREGVVAAEKGQEVRRMEDFLNRPERSRDAWQSNNAWAPSDHGGWGQDIGVDIWGGAVSDHEWGANAGWDRPAGGRGGAVEKGASPPACGLSWVVPLVNLGTWGQSEADWGIDSSGHPHGSDATTDDIPDRDVWTFAEKVARQEDLSPERKRRLHQFMQMPTDAKVQKIEEMIRSLQQWTH